jgi:hypothetical protein
MYMHSPFGKLILSVVCNIGVEGSNAPTAHFTQNFAKIGDINDGRDECFCIGCVKGPLELRSLTAFSNAAAMHQQHDCEISRADNKAQSFEANVIHHPPSFSGVTGSQGRLRR